MKKGSNWQMCHICCGKFIIYKKSDRGINVCELCSRRHGAKSDIMFNLIKAQIVAEAWGLYPNVQKLTLKGVSKNEMKRIKEMIKKDPAEWGRSPKGNQEYHWHSVVHLNDPIAKTYDNYSDYGRVFM